MKSSTYRSAGRHTQGDFDSMLDANAADLNTVIPSRRAQALLAYQSRPKTMTAEDAAGSIAGMLALDPDVGSQDFVLATSQRDRAVSRLLDPSVVRTLEALSEVWGCPQERILSEGLKMIAGVKPDGRFSDSDLLL